MPRGDGIPLHGTGGGSFSSSPCSKGEDVCNAMLSDLYAGMLHSMSRLLGARPSCIISTKTLIGQNWSFRRITNTWMNFKDTVTRKKPYSYNLLYVAIEAKFKSRQSSSKVIEVGTDREG